MQDLPLFHEHTSTPAVLPPNSTLFVGSYEYRVHAIDVDTDRLRWRHLAGNTVYSNPVVSGGIAYIGSDDGKIIALTPEETEKDLNYVDVLPYSVVLDTTIEAKVRCSYHRHHIKRCGRYRRDLENPASPDVG